MQKLMIIALALLWPAIPGLLAQETTFTDASQANLLALAEEEKLAQDVYLYFEGLYGAMPFGNIAVAEQRHMDHLAWAAAQQGLSISTAIQAGEAGRFDNPAIQQLYEEMVAEGRQSLEAALRVGARIEETDIRDLRLALAATNDEQLKEAYGRLIDASGNHLAAFSRNLAKLGVTYQPVLLAPDDYQALLANAGKGQPANGQGCKGKQAAQGKPCCQGKAAGKCCKGKAAGPGKKGL